MKITLIRHTRVAVETGICYGWSDVGVAPSFETEASRVKENISNEQFDIVYSFPLLLPGDESSPYTKVQDGGR